MADYESLRSTRDLDRVFQSGRWSRSGPVSVGTSPRGDERAARVCFVAGRAIGKSVRRNRARRRMREALRIMPVKLRPGADIVLLARPATAEAPFADLSSAIRRCLQALDLVEEASGARDDGR